MGYGHTPVRRRMTSRRSTGSARPTFVRRTVWVPLTGSGGLGEELTSVAAARPGTGVGSHVPTVEPQSPTPASPTYGPALQRTRHHCWLHQAQTRPEAHAVG